MTASSPSKGSPTVQPLPRATIRFAGDSGDGMQLTGMQFTNAAAVFGNDVSTLPDFPAEIRAPAGTVYGVSGFQLHFSSSDIHTPGDEVDTLVAMNPAALKTNLHDLKKGGIIIANVDGFTDQNLRLAGYEKSPLADGSLDDFRVHSVRMTEATTKACEEVGIAGRDAQRCKNFFALGIVCWLYSRPLDSIVNFINTKFADKEQIREANLRVLRAGYYYGETAEVFQTTYAVEKAKLAPGVYREIRGNEALSMGLITASHLAGKPLYYSSYPITPASDILHELSRHKNFGVRTVQAEDEIAAVCSAIGAAFGGALAATATAGPGLALKAEAMGLAAMMELPLVVIDVQRGGPSTGLPTKTEQSDLLQAMFSRNGDCPLFVFAPQTPGDCFHMAIQAARTALRTMTPVVLLSDGFLANSTEPWLLPDVESLEAIEINHLDAPNGPDGQIWPYERNEQLVRPWILPGTPGMMHRVGGLEKADKSGNVSYDPANHQLMTDLRAQKIEKEAELLPEQSIEGAQEGDLLLVGWGGTYGALREARESLEAEGLRVGHAHIRFINPFPRNLEKVLKSFRSVLVPELNTGQLNMLLRSRYLVDAQGLNKVQGRPFTVGEIVATARGKIEALAK